MKIKFMEDREVWAQDVCVQAFKAGEVYELTSSSARRWLRRGLATEVHGKPAATKRKPAKKSAPAKVAPKSDTLTREPPITSVDPEDPSE